jgi:hypothetical protein
MFERMGDDRCDLLCLDLERAEALRRSRLSVERASGHPRPPMRWPTRRG